MKIGQKLYCLLFLAALLVAQVPKGWSQFTSSQGAYTVNYPRSWHLLLPDLPTLLISNFSPSRRVRAVINPANGATISLDSAPAGVKDIDQWIARAVTKIGSRSSLTLPRPQSKTQLAVEEVNFESIEGPDTTSWYFEIAGRLLVANLSYWRGDPHQDKYRQVLREVTESVKILPQ